MPLTPTHESPDPLRNIKRHKLKKVRRGGSSASIDKLHLVSPKNRSPLASQPCRYWNAANRNRTKPRGGRGMPTCCADDFDARATWVVHQSQGGPRGTVVSKCFPVHRPWGPGLMRPLNVVGWNRLHNGNAGQGLLRNGLQSVCSK
ncbi:hypothetical protein CEXT_17351 [Caerostris extrusa]|uniref:Uncharacterized protein n=1 Tax=Caerostris extrusa TaxID=172846 RepID=A0AAV4MQK2_CAEEX|nr:hypothetical protein CEXT_17351 [Caerostris extrusa]